MVDGGGTRGLDLHASPPARGYYGFSSLDCQQTPVPDTEGSWPSRGSRAHRSETIGETTCGSVAVGSHIAELDSKMEIMHSKCTISTSIDS